MTEAEREALVRIEGRARYDSVRAAYAAGAVIVLLGLATTPEIKTISHEKDPKAAS